MSTSTNTVLHIRVALHHPVLYEDKDLNTILHNRIKKMCLTVQ